MPRRFDKATLVVHPRRPFARSLAAALREGGFAVLIASSNRDALGALALRPDVVIAGAGAPEDLSDDAFLSAVSERSPGTACVLLSPFRENRIACTFVRTARGTELVRDVERCMARAAPPAEEASSER